MGVTILVLEGLRVVALALALALAPKVVAAAKVIVVAATKVAAAIATASTVRSSSKEVSKEFGVWLGALLASLPFPPARVDIITGAAATGGEEEPLLRLIVSLPLPPATGTEASTLLAPTQDPLDGRAQYCGPQGPKAKANNTSVYGRAASYRSSVGAEKELGVSILVTRGSCGGSGSCVLGAGG